MPARAFEALREQARQRHTLNQLDFISTFAVRRFQRVTYALAVQEKWADFDEHYPICKQIETRAQTDEAYKISLSKIELIEKVLKERNYSE